MAFNRTPYAWSRHCYNEAHKESRVWTFYLNFPTNANKLHDRCFINVKHTYNGDSASHEAWQGCSMKGSHDVQWLIASNRIVWNLSVLTTGVRIIKSLRYIILEYTEQPWNSVWEWYPIKEIWAYYKPEQLIANTDIQPRQSNTVYCLTKRTTPLWFR